MANSHVYWYWVHLLHSMPEGFDKEKIFLFKLMIFEFMDGHPANNVGVEAVQDYCLNHSPLANH